MDYEFCFIIKDNYSDPDGLDIGKFWGDWADFPQQVFDERIQPKDGYCYVDSIDELFPPVFTSSNQQRLIMEIKKHLIEL